MLDHVSLSVAELERSAAFYDEALEPLGLTCISGAGGHAGYGADRPFFWIGVGRRVGFAHVAFEAPSRAAVDAFYAAALAAGGLDNGPPGPRPYYHPNYYGAFVLDPDGNNIEAVCRGRE